MPNEQRPLKVFLCHAHADRKAVRMVYSRLKREGIDVWLDKEKLLPGVDWELEISKAVRETDVVVVCLSKHFNEAGFRQKEVRLALDTAMEKPEGDIFIIPARLEDCDTLDSLRKWHWVDLFEENGYSSLIRALRARAEKTGAILRMRRGDKSSSPHPTEGKPVRNMHQTAKALEIIELFPAYFNSLRIRALKTSPFPRIGSIIWSPKRLMSISIIILLGIMMVLYSSYYSQIPFLWPFNSPTAIALSQTAAASPPTIVPTCMFDQEADQIEAYLNAELLANKNASPLDELRQTLGPRYRVLDVNFPMEENGDCVFQVEVNCECAANDNCCNSSTTFIAAMDILSNYSTQIISLVPGTTKYMVVYAYDHANQYEVMRVAWEDVKMYFSGQITGSQLASRVHRN
jgi:hypothetical protein